MDVTETIKTHKEQIINDSNSGCTYAQGIVSTYTMWQKVPSDQCALALCECHLRDWLKKNGK